MPTMRRPFWPGREAPWYAHYCSPAEGIKRLKRLEVRFKRYWLIIYIMSSLEKGLGWSEMWGKTKVWLSRQRNKDNVKLRAKTIQKRNPVSALLHRYISFFLVFFSMHNMYTMLWGKCVNVIEVWMHSMTKYIMLL